MITRQNLQAQFFTPLALELLLRIFLAAIDPKLLQSLAFYRSVFAQQTDQGFDESAIEVRVLRLAQEQVESLFEPFR